MKCVVMINCGGCFNVLELLQPEDDVKFYIIDRYFEEVVTMYITEPLMYHQLQTTAA